MRHYDAEGRLTGTTVRESHWTDTEREKMFALAEFEAQQCDCGLPMSIADTDPDVQIEHRVCPICASLAIREREQDAVDEARMSVFGDKPAPSIQRPTDGRHQWHRLEDPAVLLAPREGQSEAEV